MTGAELNAVIIVFAIIGIIFFVIKMRAGGFKLPSLPTITSGDKKNGGGLKLPSLSVLPGDKVTKSTLVILGCFLFLEVSLYLYKPDLPIFKGAGWWHLVYYPAGILLLSVIDEYVPSGFRRFMAKTMVIVAFSLAGFAHLSGSSSSKDVERSVVRATPEPRIIERLVAVEEEYTTLRCNGKNEAIPIPYGETVEVNPGEGCDIAFDVLRGEVVVWGSMLPKTKVSVEGGLHSKERGRYMRAATSADAEVDLVRCPKGSTMKHWRCYRTVMKTVRVAVN